MKPTLSIAVFMALSGCLNETIYESSNSALKCERLVGPRYEECIKQTPMSYDEYQEQRKALLEESNSQ